MFFAKVDTDMEASAHHEGYVRPTNESCDKDQYNDVPQEPRGHDPPKLEPSISA